MRKESGCAYDKWNIFVVICEMYCLTDKCLVWKCILTYIVIYTLFYYLFKGSLSEFRAAQFLVFLCSGFFRLLFFFLSFFFWLLFCLSMASGGFRLFFLQEPPPPCVSIRENNKLEVNQIFLLRFYHHERVIT